MVKECLAHTLLYFSNWWAPTYYHIFLKSYPSMAQVKIGPNPRPTTFLDHSFQVAGDPFSSLHFKQFLSCQLPWATLSSGFVQLQHTKQKGGKGFIEWNHQLISALDRKQALRDKQIYKSKYVPDKQIHGTDEVYAWYYTYDNDTDIKGPIYS